VRVKPPRDFRNAGELDARLVGRDPRDTAFRERAVEVDLRRCALVRPAAALWCLIYPLLAKRRGAECSANLHPLVSEVFAELALNAVEHAESPIGAFGFVQFYEFSEGQRFVCGVADGGIGIRASLERNPTLRSRVPYDWAAIELAVRERVTGTGDQTRGIGLYGVAEDMRKPGRQLILHSGIGSLMISEDMETEAKRTSLFAGTLAYASIPA